MAQIEILTLNQNGDGWVDTIPGSQVSTSYQAQNTNITARTLGLDMSNVSVVGSSVTVTCSGAIDINGVPYTFTSDVVFAQSEFQQVATYFEIIDGSVPTEKSLRLNTVEPSWNPTKNYFESSAGNRVLNWVVSKENGLLIATRLKLGVKNSNDVVGLGIGSRRIFVDPGTYVIPITADGIYTIGGCGSGGRSVDPENPDLLEGYGSKGGRVRVRLNIGDIIEINVSAAANYTSGVYCGTKLAASWGIDTAVATGTAILAETHYSGGTPFINESFQRAGGGAGMFGAGKNGNQYVVGNSFHGYNYGEGFVSGGNGYMEAFWEGE